MKIYSINWKKWVDIAGVHPKQISGTTTYYQPDEDGYCSCAMCQYYKWYYRGIDRDADGYCTCSDCAAQRKKEKKKNSLPDELFEL